MSEVCKRCGGTGVPINYETLRTKRLTSGKKLHIVAGRMGISPQYLCDLEQGRRDWNAELLAKFNAVMPKK